MNRDMDIRRLPVEDVEIREADDGSMSLRGYAAVFNSLSEPIFGMFRERIAPGAFKRSIADGDHDVYALWQHDSSFPLARKSKGTLRLAEDKRGLAVEIDLPATSYGRDAAEAVRSGLVDKMSFGFGVPEGGDRLTDERSEDGYPIRELTDVELYEVSPVTFPAYPDTQLSARSLEAVESMKAVDAEADEAVSALDRYDIRRRRLDMHEATS